MHALWIFLLLLFPAPSTRSFEMGTINWLANGEKTAQKDIDLAVKHTIGASDHILVQLRWSPLQTNLADRANWMASIARDNHRKLTIAIDWQDPARRDLLDRSANWRFADENVRQAFVQSICEAAKRHHPDNFVLGVEVNYYARMHPEDFPKFVTLYRDVRAKIKEISPATNVLVTFQYELLSGKDASWKSKLDVSPIEAFGDSLDMLGIATYPHLSGIKPKNLDEKYFAAIDRFKQPWGIFETSWPTISSDDDQAEYLHRLLDVCQKRHAKILIWTATTDTAEPAENAAKWMSHLGLWNLKGEAKKSAREWMDWRGRELSPHR